MVAIAELTVWLSPVCKGSCIVSGVTGAGESVCNDVVSVPIPIVESPSLVSGLLFLLFGGCADPVLAAARELSFASIVMSVDARAVSLPPSCSCIPVCVSAQPGGERSALSTKMDEQFPHRSFPSPLAVAHLRHTPGANLGIQLWQKKVSGVAAVSRPWSMHVLQRPGNRAVDAEGRRAVALGVVSPDGGLLAMARTTRKYN